MCDCLGEEPVCDDYDERLVTPDLFVLSHLQRRHQPEPEPLPGGRLCPVHVGVEEPCPTCGAYIAAGL